MCSTYGCYGDCEECEADKKQEQEREEFNTECPLRRECHVVTVNTKTDKCTTCNRVFAY